MGQRLLGEDVSVLIVANKVVQATITDVKSAEITVQTEILREGFLGESTDRRDDIFRGVAGKLEMQVENEDFLTLVRTIVDRARRKAPGTIINIKMALNFPNGDRPMIMLPDAKFGPIPIGFPGRTEYGTFALDFETEDFQVIG